MNLLLVDKDGTLVSPKSGETFVQYPQDQKLLPNVLETIARCAANGWTIAIISNQGGVAAGYKTLEQAIAEMRYCLSLLPVIKWAYFCPDNGLVCYEVGDGRQSKWNRQSLISNSDDDESFYAEEEIYTEVASFRKPESGMIQLALENLPEASINVLFVGDRPEDAEAAKAAKVPFMWAKEFFGWREND